MTKLIEHGATVLAVPTFEAVHFSVFRWLEHRKVKATLRAARWHFFAPLPSLTIRKRLSHITRRNTKSTIQDVDEPTNRDG